VLASTKPVVPLNLRGGGKQGRRTGKGGCVIQIKRGAQPTTNGDVEIKRRLSSSKGKKRRRNCEKISYKGLGGEAHHLLSVETINGRGKKKRSIPVKKYPIKSHPMHNGRCLPSMVKKKGPRFSILILWGGERGGVFDQQTEVQ